MRRISALSTFAAIFVTISRGAVAAPPPAEASRACFDAARSWLRDDHATSGDAAENKGKDAPLPALPEVPCSAAAVIIRLDGRPVGQAWKAGPETGLAARCLQEAWAQARADRRIASMPPDLRDRLGDRVTLEMEFAGDPEPLVGDRLDTLASRVDPALEAFAIRNGDRWAFAMPSLLQARNQAPLLNYLAMGVARDAGLDPAASRDLRLPDGAAAYRAPTRRLAQASFDAEPFESWRGSRLVELASIDAPAVRRMASGVAAHLAQRWPNTEGLPPDGVAAIEALGPRSDYQPATGTWPSAISAPAEQALAALAMARWSRHPGLDATERDAARAFACRTLASLRDVTAEESDPRSDAAATACVLLAARELDAPGATPDAKAWSDVRLRAWIDQLRDSLRASGAGTTPPAGTAAAMACAALGPAADESLMRRAWDPRQAERALQATPWIADRMPADASAAWSDALRQLIAAQCPDGSGRGPRDAAGGWGGSAAAPRPTAASAKATLALATALSTPGLVGDADRRAGIESLRRSLRFLRQLQADEWACHAFRDPARAIGGIRSAPWDSDEPMAASAYALLACMASEPLLTADGDAAKQP